MHNNHAPVSHTIPAYVQIGHTIKWPYDIQYFNHIRPYAIIADIQHPEVPIKVSVALPQPLFQSLGKVKVPGSVVVNIG